MNVASHFGRAFAATLCAGPARLLSELSDEKLMAPCFHVVRDGAAPRHVRHLFQCPDLKSFATDLDRLLKGRVPLSLAELSGFLTEGRPFPRGAVFISFDDGLREMSDIVAPFLLRKGIPATFFLTTGFLDNRMMFFRHKVSLLLEELSKQGQVASRKIEEQMSSQSLNVPDATAFLRGVRYHQANFLDRCATAIGLDFADYLQHEQPYLTGNQVDVLLSQGFTIGGHSIDHPLFADLDLNRQIEQTTQCLDYLMRRFSMPNRTFAFPFVSTGISQQYYDTIFNGEVDLAFCIGGTPEAYQKNVVERFGVESMDNDSSTTAWRRHTNGRLRNRFTKPGRATA